MGHERLSAGRPVGHVVDLPSPFPFAAFHEERHVDDMPDRTADTGLPQCRWRPTRIQRSKEVGSGHRPQRGHGLKPRVVPAHRGYPGSAGGKDPQPQRGCGLIFAPSPSECDPRRPGRETPQPCRGCLHAWEHDPRVAALRQPWVGRQNAFGVGPAAEASC